MLESKGKVVLGLVKVEAERTIIGCNMGVGVQAEVEEGFLSTVGVAWSNKRKE